MKECEGPTVTDREPELDATLGGVGQGMAIFLFFERDVAIFVPPNARPSGERR